MAFLLVLRLPEPSTANTDFSMGFLLHFRFLLFGLAVSSSSSESTSTPSSSPGSHPPFSTRAHLCAKVFNSLTVLGSRTLILECILLLCTFKWNGAITTTGCCGSQALPFLLWKNLQVTGSSMLLMAARKGAGHCTGEPMTKSSSSAGALAIVGF